MQISDWRVDELGNLTRTITGVAAPVEIVAAMQEVGRRGGLASASAVRARARKQNPASRNGRLRGEGLERMTG
jgi:hypothetical protein